MKQSKLIIYLLGALSILYSVYSLFFTSSKSDSKKPTDLSQRVAIETQIFNETNYTQPDIDKAIDRAIRIGEKLGVAYSWYNPASWTESDQDVFNILVGLQDAEIELVKTSYVKIYSRDLVLDLTKYLDSELFNVLKPRL